MKDKFQISNFKFQINTNKKFLLIGNWKLEIGYLKFPRRGFTLVELVIVIGIIGIFAGGLIASVNPIEQFQKSNDANRKSDLGNIQKALEIYYQDNGRYPANPASSDYRIYSRDSSGTLTTIAWGAAWQPYMSKLPKDPNNTKTYVYSVSTDGQTYYLYASLDRGNKDPQICNSGNRCLNAPVDATCGSVCNFGIVSSNTTP